MISTIWIAWALNQFINLIILLNFLIALISETYGHVTRDYTVYNYGHRAAINQECRILMRFLGLLKPIDYLIVQH